MCVAFPFCIISKTAVPANQASTKEARQGIEASVRTRARNLLMNQRGRAKCFLILSLLLKNNGKIVSGGRRLGQLVFSV